MNCQLEALPLIRFTRDDAQAAADSWGFNCGPGALCAVSGMTPSEIRPHLGDFERKGYTNPKLMYEILRRLFSDNWTVTPLDNWPGFGLVRIQWHGPWMSPSVPIRARYRQTHWIAYRLADNHVFDVNAMCVGGWLPEREWSTQLVPWLLRQCVPRANGDWSRTHVIELSSTGQVRQEVRR